MSSNDSDQQKITFFLIKSKIQLESWCKKQLAIPETRCYRFLKIYTPFYVNEFKNREQILFDPIIYI